jgi:RimJ/RimL family protein N-acetyltransferase
MTLHLPLPAARPRSHRTPDHVVARLSHGGIAVLRPLRAGETEPLLAVFEGLSPASRFSRFLVGVPRLPSSMLSALVDLDGHDHVAWLASIGGMPAGVARSIRVAPDTAEIAFEVADVHQGHGLGTVLLDTVTTVAAAHGVRRVRATVQPANAPSLRLLARLGIPLTLNDGLLEGEGPLRLLDPSVVNRRAVVALAQRQAGPVSQEGPVTSACG